MNLRQDIGALKPPIQTAASFTVSPRVQSILQNAEKLGRLSPDATAENLNLQNVAKSLTSDDAKQLLQVMLRPGEFKSSQRSLSVFLLAQRPENFSNELSTIAADSNELLVKKTTAHSEADALKIFEVSLRLEALDALDQLNGNGSSQSQELIFTRVQNSTHHPLIAKVASIGRAGARAHRALIASFIQHNLAPALRETSNVD